MNWGKLGIGSVMSNEELYEEADKYYNNQEYKKAFHLFLKLAKDDDDTVAKDMLSYMYHAGEGVKKSREKRKFWLKKSSQCGSYYADHWLACLYFEENKIKRGLTLLEENIEDDYIESIVFLAGCYYHGEYVLKDEEKAMFLYEKASSLGDKESAKYLVSMYNMKYGSRRKSFIPLVKSFYRMYKYNKNKEKK